MSIPSTSLLEPLITQIVKASSNTDEFTLNQLRASLKAELLDGGTKEGKYDFDSKEYKVKVKEIAIKVFAAAAAATTESSSKPKKKRKHEEEEEKREEDSNEDDDKENVERGQKEKKKKKEKRSKHEEKKKSSRDSVESTTAVEEDPRLKCLKKMALAMGTVPAIYKGFGEMDTEEKMSALRKRLKEKGAKFVDLPTKEQIKEAEEARALVKDLEGIDTSNIIASGSRRRAARDSAYGGADEEEKKKKKKKKKRKTSEAASSSSSEDELEF